jgi:hypothetical protein
MRLLGDMVQVCVTTKTDGMFAKRKKYQNDARVRPAPAHAKQCGSFCLLGGPRPLPLARCCFVQAADNLCTNSTVVSSVCCYNCGSSEYIILEHITCTCAKISWHLYFTGLHSMLVLDANNCR